MLLSKFDIQGYVNAEVAGGIIDAADKSTGMRAAAPPRLLRAFKSAGDALKLPGAEATASQLLEVRIFPVSPPGNQAKIHAGIQAWLSCGAFASLEWISFSTRRVAFIAHIRRFRLCSRIGHFCAVEAPAVRAQALVCASPSQHFAACLAVALGAPRGREEARAQVLSMLSRLPVEVCCFSGLPALCGVLVSLNQIIGSKCSSNDCFPASACARSVFISLPGAQVLSPSVVAESLHDILSAIRVEALVPPYLPYELLERLLQVT